LVEKMGKDKGTHWSAQNKSQKGRKENLTTVNLGPSQEKIKRTGKIGGRQDTVGVFITSKTSMGFRKSGNTPGRRFNDM